jgi:methylenetetrahydrofolate reductase (NADPH)
VLARGVDVPIVPGIMPITNYAQLARFSDACGAEIPRWIKQRLLDFGDDMDSLRAFGHDTVLRLCEVLIREGVPSLHFYTLNQTVPTSELVKAIRPLIG